MEICFRIGGQTHCYVIPVVEAPIGIVRPGPGPINYSELVQDALLIASLQATANRVSDDGVRSALQGGIGAAMEALRARGGEHVSLRPESR